MGKLRFPVDKEHIYFDFHQSRLLGNQMQHDGGVFPPEKETQIWESFRASILFAPEQR
jgi:hypothetical protein